MEDTRNSPYKSLVVPGLPFLTQHNHPHPSSPPYKPPPSPPPGTNCAFFHDHKYMEVLLANSQDHILLVIYHSNISLNNSLTSVSYIQNLTGQPTVMLTSFFFSQSFIDLVRGAFVLVPFFRSEKLTSQHSAPEFLFPCWTE